MSYWNVAYAGNVCAKEPWKKRFQERETHETKRNFKNACSPVCRGGQQYTKNKKQGVSIMSDVVLFSLLPPNGKKKE